MKMLERAAAIANHRKLPALALAAGAALLAGGVQGVELGRIMPMGDSITDGVPVAGGDRRAADAV